MEDLKSSFAPMLTFASFDGSMDASSGYYYHSSSASSVDSSPVMAGVSSFDSSPSPPPFYGNSFETGSTLASPQYYMQESGNCLEQYQPAQEFFTTATISPTATSNNMLGGSQQQSHQQSVHIPGLNELTRLFNMAAKVEDKLAIQAKINSLLFEHLPLNKRQQQKQQMLLQQQQHPQQQITYMVDSNELIAPNHTLITPPLSPNGDNIGMFMSKQNPMFVQHSPLKQSNSGATRSPMLATAGHQVVKVEPPSPSLMGGRKISQSSFGEAANNSNGSTDSTNNNSGLLLAGGGQSPSQNNSSKTSGSIYFEQSPGQQQQQQYTGGQQYGNGSSVLVSESTSIPETVLPIDQAVNGNQSNCAELKSIMVAAAAAAAAGKPSKIGKGKGKGKGKKADLRKSTGASMSGINGLGHGGSPPQSQKRTAHLSAEFRYRTKLNDKISKLRSLVGQKVHLSKSAVLTRSIERIVKLQKLTIRLHESNLRLQSLVAKYTGGANAATQNSESTKAANAPLMSIKELTRSLSVSSGTSLLSSGRGGNGQFGGSNQTTIDIDLAKYIDSQMLSSPESDHLPATIESTVNCSSSNISTSSSSSSVPSVASSVASQSLALSPNDEVFDFDQFLDQF